MRRSLPLVAIAAVLLSGCGNLFETAAATVNGRKIDEDRFTRELDFLLADPRFAEQLATGEQGEIQQKELARQYLTFLIHQELVREFAEGNDIDISDDRVAGLLRQQVTQSGGREAFERQLRESGVSETDVRTLLEQQLLRQRVAEAVVADRLSEERLREVYAERQGDFAEVHAAHILVQTKQEADRIRGQATPANFGDLARQFSQDPGSAEGGGDLGTRPASAFVQPFARALLTAKPGEIVGPVQTEFGFHVIRVIDRQTQPFEAVRPQLVGDLRGRVFTEWLMERVGVAEIRVNPRYGSFDEGSGTVIERRSTSPAPRRSPQLAP